MRKSRTILTECRGGMVYTCPRMTHKDQLPTRKVTANYRGKKPELGGRILFTHQLHKTEMSPQTKLPFLDPEHSLHVGETD